MYVEVSISSSCDISRFRQMGHTDTPSSLGGGAFCDDIGWGAICPSNSPEKKKSPPGREDHSGHCGGAGGSPWATIAAFAPRNMVSRSFAAVALIPWGRFLMIWANLPNKAYLTNADTPSSPTTTASPVSARVTGGGEGPRHADGAGAGGMDDKISRSRRSGVASSWNEITPATFRLTGWPNP